VKTQNGVYGRFNTMYSTDFSEREKWIAVFNHDFFRCVDFTHIAASNIASDDVTN